MITPIATLLCNNRAPLLTYRIDSGADVSVIKNSAVKTLNGVIKPVEKLQAFVGFGNHLVYALGICDLITVLPTLTLDISFMVVRDDVIPSGLDMLIGLDVIVRPSIRIGKSADGLIELYNQSPNVPKVLTLKTLCGNVQVNQPELESDLKLRLETLLTTYKDKTPDHISVGKMVIRLKDNEPVVYNPRRLAYEERAQVKKMVQELLVDGVIRESRSEYASPVVLVRKKNGELRMCIDYRDVNKRVVRERYPLPVIQDQINALCRAKYFTTLDMK